MAVVTRKRRLPSGEMQAYQTLLCDRCGLGNKKYEVKKYKTHGRELELCSGCRKRLNVYVPVDPPGLT